MTGRRCHALLILGLLLVLISVRPAEAVNPETLLMPGKLSAAHVKYEEQCSLCHDRTDRNRQTQLCLDCHKEIAGDLKQRRGFHGKFPGIDVRSEEHTSELQSPCNLVCRLLLEKKKKHNVERSRSRVKKSQFDGSHTSFTSWVSVVFRKLPVSADCILLSTHHEACCDRSSSTAH